jgi:hypothetical protein
MFASVIGDFLGKRQAKNEFFFRDRLCPAQGCLLKAFGEGARRPSDTWLLWPEKIVWRSGRFASETILARRY